MPHELAGKIKAALNGDRSSAFNEAQRKVIGYALSEIRHQLRQEQATAIEKIEHRIEELEARVGTPE